MTTLLQFDLRFDDPRLPEEQRVNIHGHSDQLEALHEAVTTYVQDLLNQSPNQFNAFLSAQAITSSDVTELGLSTDDSPALLEQPLPLDPSHGSTHLGFGEIAPKDPTITPTGEIFLQPGRGLSHNLFLGSLATEETGAVIQLSVLQLFDLTTALDAYTVDVVALPTESRPRLVAAPTGAWASIAAVLLLAVGLTTVVQLLHSGSQQQTADRSAKQGSSSNNQQSIALQPSPLPPLPSSEILPSLPPASIVPSPNPSLPSVPVPKTIPTLPSTTQGTALKMTPFIASDSLAKARQTVPFIASTTPRTAPQTTALKPISPLYPLSPEGTPIPSITPPPPILINPVPRQGTSAFIPGEATSPSKSDAPTPSFPLTPPSAAIPSLSPENTPFNPNVEGALSNATRSAAPAPESSSKPTAQQSRESDIQQQGAESTQAMRSSSTPTTPNDSKGTAFDIIPQVGEAREYFKKRWEPPSGLTQPLEYSLLLDVDGTIQRIVPLGQAARNFVDRTGMPLIGESFVSPNKNGQTPTIRLVLNPDGKVQTFLESSNR